MFRKFLFCFVLALTVFSLCAEDAAETAFQVDNISEYANVVVDCFTASVAAVYSPTKVSLPSCTVSVDSDSGLPSRVAFFLADPYEIQLAIKNSIGVKGNFLSALITLFQTQQKDPFLSSVYVTMSSREYQEKKFLINGYITLSYPEESTLESLESFLLSRSSSNGSVEASISIKIICKNSAPVSINGTFNMSLDENGAINVVSCGEYFINEYVLEEANYSF